MNTALPLADLETAARSGAAVDRERGWMHDGEPGTRAGGWGTARRWAGWRGLYGLRCADHRTGGSNGWE